MRSSLEQRVEDLENAGGGVTTFLALTDTPATYTGKSLKVARVNVGETALEFVTLAGGGDMLAANNLSDVANVSTARTNLGLNTTANQTDSTDKRFMSDAQETKLDAITGTNTGDQTSIVGISGTKANFDTACSDGNFLYVGDIVGVTDGWATIVKSANQDVTNNATFQDDTDLQFSVVAGGHYMVEMSVCWSANDANGDYKFAFSVSTGVIRGYGVCVKSDAIGNLIISTPAGGSISTSTQALQTVATNLDFLMSAVVYFNIFVSANATFKYQFANITAAAGRTSRTWKGSILKYKRID